MADEADSVLAEPVDAATLDRRAEDELDRVQDVLYRESAAVVRSALRWADVDMVQVVDGEVREVVDPPEEWVMEMGLEEARRAFRIAKAANLPGSQAPAGLKMAVDIYRGVMASKAQQKQTHVALGVMVVPMYETPQLPAVVTKKGEDS